MTGFKGGCLCSAVRYESEGDPVMAGHCQCVDCRKSSGSGHCTHVAVVDQGFSISGAVKLYDRSADSGNIVSRAFCPECGSALFSRNTGIPGMVFVRASSLDDPEIIRPAMVVYASRAVSWDHIGGDLPTFATMPPGGPDGAIADNDATARAASG